MRPLQLLVILLFVAGGMALAWVNFRKFPWKEKPTRGQWLTTLSTHLIIGGGIGFMAGGWAAGRLPG